MFIFTTTDIEPNSSGLNTSEEEFIISEAETDIIVLPPFETALSLSLFISSVRPLYLFSDFTSSPI